MGNQQPSTYGRLTDAIVNARLGDGSFWKHPESRNYKIVWSSIHEEWILWKMENLLPRNLMGSVTVRDAAKREQDGGTYDNAKPLYTGTSLVDPRITRARTMDAIEALHLMTDLGLGLWFLDDGCTVKRNDSNSYRVTISVGTDLSGRGPEVLEWARERFQTNNVGRVYRNNSRASERNKSWIIPKAVAVRIMSHARRIAPAPLRYKVPIW